ncbi:MAG: hypothetical protein D6739_10445, partial [Nitrospirae bacterium]
MAAAAAAVLLLLASPAAAGVRETIEAHAEGCGYTSEDVEVLAAAAEVYAAGGGDVASVLEASLAKCQPADQIAKVLIMGSKEEPEEASPTAAAAERIEPDLTVPEMPPLKRQGPRPKFASLLDPGESILDAAEHPSRDYRLTPEAYSEVDTRLPMVNPFPELPDLPFHDLVLVDGFPLLLPDLPFIRILPVDHQELKVPGELIVAGAIPTGTLAA